MTLQNTPEEEQEYLKYIEENKHTASHPRQSVISPEQQSRLVAKVQKRKDCPRFAAISGITMLLQTGGSSASCTGNHTFTFQNYIFKLSELRTDVKEVTGNNSSMRKVARSFATRIFITAKAIGEPGNLYRKIQRMDPEFTWETDDIYWCSDFQANNPDCPERIRSTINRTFSTKPQKKGRQNGKKHK